MVAQNYYNNIISNYNNIISTFQISNIMTGLEKYYVNTELNHCNRLQIKGKLPKPTS